MFFTHLFIYMKRHLINPCFVIAVLIMPLVAAAFVLCYRVSPVNIRVALYGDGKSALNIEEKLINSENSVEFIMCKSEAEVNELVTKNSAECGYIFGDKFERAFETGDSNEFKRSITIVTSPSSMLDPVINEVVFSAVTDAYCGIIADDEAKKQGLESDMIELYNGYLTGDMVFRADISSVKNEYEQKTSSGENNIKKIISGVLAVYILLGSVLGASDVIGDVKRNIRKGGYACVLAAMLIMCAAAQAILCVLYGFYAKDVLVMLIYCFAVSGFANVLRALKSRTVLCGMLPVLVIGGFAFSDIFSNVTMFPVIEIVRWIFPSGWYMYGLNGGNEGLVVLIGIAVVVNLFGFGINKLEAQ